MRIKRVLLIGLGLFSASSFNLVLSPTVLEIDTQRSGISQVVITNNTNQSVPLEASLRRIIFQENGEHITQEVHDDNLLVFPLASILRPAQSQVFRLQWIGQKTQIKSESYYLRLSQPVLSSQSKGSQNTDASHAAPQALKRSGISVQVHYNALVHVFSQSQSPDVVLHVEQNGEAKLINNGNRYTYLSLIKFVPINAAQSTKSPVQFHHQLDERFIPPLSTLSIYPKHSLPPGEYQGLIP